MGYNQKTMFSNSPATVTEQGGRGFLKEPKIELYSLIVTSLLSGDVYYEKADERLKRLRGLIDQVHNMKDGDEFLIGLAVYARNEMYMRTSPTMLAVELFLKQIPGANKAAHQIFLRGDEHLEALAYIKSLGEKRPKQLLKTIAQILNEFTPYKAAKYKCEGKGFSQRDALRLSHPTPKDARQSAIFKYITQGFDKLTPEERVLVPELIRMQTGQSMTWEQQISGKGSTKENWEQIIPKMGYMALLRNLRNFVEKGVNRQTLEKVAEKLADKVEVRNCKQLPWRFLNAYNALSELGSRIEVQILGRGVRKALDHSVYNIPNLDGNTLILADTSGSMRKPVGGNTPRPGTTPIQAYDLGIILGSMLAGMSTCEFYLFEDNATKVTFGAGDDTITRIEKAKRQAINGGTRIGYSFRQAINMSQNTFKRAVILTDEQGADDLWTPVREYRQKHPGFSCYAINLVGTKVSALPVSDGAYQLAGYSDRLFNWMSEEEATSPAIVSKITAIGKAIIQGSYDPKAKNSEDEGEE